MTEPERPTTSDPQENQLRESLAIRRRPPDSPSSMENMAGVYRRLCASIAAESAIRRYEAPVKPESVAHNVLERESVTSPEVVLR